MTRNRNRKDQARQLQRETGARRAAAYRAHDARKQRSLTVPGLLADAAAAVAAADPAAAGFLPPPGRPCASSGRLRNSSPSAPGPATTGALPPRRAAAGRRGEGYARGAGPAERAGGGQPGGQPR